MKKQASLILFSILLLISLQSAQAADRWVTTWATGQQLTEPHNNPPSPFLSNNTLRQVIHVSIGGKKLRFQFSNEHGNDLLEIQKVEIAVSAGADAFKERTNKALLFKGKPSVTLAAQEAVLSDPINFNLAALSDLTVTILFGAVPKAVTGHPGSRTTSYLKAGDAVRETPLTDARKTEHWYVLSRLDVVADAKTAAIVVLGDSLTDGRGSTTNGNDRWPDNLARRLQANAATKKVAVVNQGVGGNAVFGGLGVSAVSRFDRDLLGMSGAKWLVILEGVNDIGSAGDKGAPAMAERLIAAYEQFIEKAHAKKLLIYGVPILPFGGSGYDREAREAARQTVNNWMRTSGKFDAVLDLDEAVRDPANPGQLLSEYDSGDHLHLNQAGYKKMAEAIDLKLFKP